MPILSNRDRHRAFAAFALLALSTAASANAGIPMLAITWPVQWLAFFPVVAGEAAMLSTPFGQSFRSLVKPVAAANLASTLVGVPIAWFAMLMLEGAGGMLLSVLPEHVADSTAFRYATFPIFSAWIASGSPLGLKAAFVVLMVVFCGVSVLVERWVLGRYFPVVDRKTLGRAVLRANVASYLLLSVVAVVSFTLAA